MMLFKKTRASVVLILPALIAASDGQSTPLGNPAARLGALTRQSDEQEAEQEPSWVDLAFVNGDWEAARRAAEQEKGPGWEELAYLLSLTSPRPADRRYEPPFTPVEPSIRVDSESGGLSLVRSWYSERYLADRWEAWCLRYAFAGRRYWEIDAVFEFLLEKDLPQVRDYLEHLRQTRSDLNELFDAAASLTPTGESEAPDLLACLAEAPPRGWLVVPSGRNGSRKLLQADLTERAKSEGRRRKPIVLLPGADFDYRSSADNRFEIPAGTTLWLPRGLRSRPSKGSLVEVRGRVVTYGAADEAVQFKPRRGTWRGLRIRYADGTPRTTWLQDWTIEGAEVGLQTWLNRYRHQLTCHRCKLSNCTVGVARASTKLSDPIDRPTHARLWIEDCEVLGFESVGMTFGGDTILLNTTIAKGHTALKPVGSVLLFAAGCEFVDCVLPMEVVTAAEQRVEIRLSTLKPRRGKVRIKVHGSRSMMVSEIYWGTSKFSDAFVEYAGAPLKESPVLPQDLEPLKSAPEWRGLR